MTYPSCHSQVRKEQGPLWLLAVLSPQPSCSLQLEIIFVGIMGMELLIKKLRSKMHFSSSNLSGVGFHVPVPFFFYYYGSHYINATKFKTHPIYIPYM